MANDDFGRDFRGLFRRRNDRRSPTRRCSRVRPRRTRRLFRAYHRVRLRAGARGGNARTGNNLRGRNDDPLRLQAQFRGHDRDYGARRKRRQTHGQIRRNAGRRQSVRRESPSGEMHGRIYSLGRNGPLRAEIYISRLQIRGNNQARGCARDRNARARDNAEYRILRQFRVFGRNRERRLRYGEKRTEKQLRGDPDGLPATRRAARVDGRRGSFLQLRDVQRRLQAVFRKLSALSARRYSRKRSHTLDRAAVYADCGQHGGRAGLGRLHNRYAVLPLPSLPRRVGN